MSSNSSPNADSTDDPSEAVVRYLFERVYSKGEFHRIDDVIAPDAIGYSTEAGRATVGPTGFRAHVVRLRTAFDGLTVAIEDLRVHGDTFSVAWTATGTHERRFQRVEPTCNVGPAGEEPHGNRLEIAGETSGAFRDGKIEEIRTTWDATDLRRQLGESTGAAESDTGVDGSTRQKPAPDRAATVRLPTDRIVTGSGGY